MRQKVRSPRTALVPFPDRKTDTRKPGRPSTRSYARLSQPGMLQRLREFQAGRYTPRTRYEKRDLNRRLREYTEAGVGV